MNKAHPTALPIAARPRVSAGPRYVLLSFIDAIEAGDADAAQRLCTETGWAPVLESARDVYLQATQRRLTLAPARAAARMLQRRAVAPVDLCSPDGASRHTMWFLMVEEDDQWRLERITDSRGLANLFLRDVIPPALQWPHLPASATAAAWGRALLDALQSHSDDVQRMLGEWDSPQPLHTIWLFSELNQAAGLVLGESVGLETINLFATSLRFESATGHARTRWFMLTRRPDASIRCHAIGAAPSLEMLFAPYDSDDLHIVARPEDA